MESPHDFGFNLKIIPITAAFLHFNLKVMVNWRHKKKSFTSKNDGLWVLVYKEEFKTRSEAVKREKQLKSSRGREFIKNLINKT